MMKNLHKNVYMILSFGATILIKVQIELMEKPNRIL